MQQQFFLLQADTSSAAYRFGYQFGSWLPFIFLLILTVMVVRMVLRRRGKKEVDEQV